MNGALQPMNTLVLGRSCTFPCDVVSSFSGRCSRSSVALIFSSSIFITMPRDSSCLWAGSVIEAVMVPSAWRLASCCQALWVPGPISKSLFFLRAATDLAAVALYLVDGTGIAGRDDQVVVVVDVYGVDVEVVVEIVGHHLAPEGLLDADVLQAVPLEEHPPVSMSTSWAIPSIPCRAFRPPIEERSVRAGT